MKSVSICIATFKRPIMLDRILSRIQHLSFKENPKLIIEIVIVDNDKNGSARKVANDWKKKIKWPLIYQIESKRGIPYVRNRLVELAKHSDFIAFIDDDEVPYEDWLDNLLTVQKKYQADVVSGAVKSRFEDEPPIWIKKIKKFNPNSRVTGTVLKTCATNNVLISKKVFYNLDRPFEEKLALNGADDTLFFSKLYNKKHIRIIWCNTAIVEEFVPKSRLTTEWNFRRAYRTGNGLALCDRYINKNKTWIIKRVFKGFGKIVFGILMLFSATFHRDLYLVPAVCHILHGIGSITGILNIQYNEYAIIHGE